MLALLALAKGQAETVHQQAKWWLCKEEISAIWAAAEWVPDELRAISREYIGDIFATFGERALKISTEPFWIISQKEDNVGCTLFRGSNLLCVCCLIDDIFSLRCFARLALSKR